MLQPRACNPPRAKRYGTCTKSSSFIPADLEGHENALAHLAQPATRTWITTVVYHIPTARASWSIFALAKFSNLTRLVIRGRPEARTLSQAFVDALEALTLEMNSFNFVNFEPVSPSLRKAERSQSPDASSLRPHSASALASPRTRYTLMISGQTVECRG